MDIEDTRKILQEILPLLVCNISGNQSTALYGVGKSKDSILIVRDNDEKEKLEKMYPLPENRKGTYITLREISNGYLKGLNKTIILSPNTVIKFLDMILNLSNEERTKTQYKLNLGDKLNLGASKNPPSADEIYNIIRDYKDYVKEYE